VCGICGTINPRGVIREAIQTMTDMTMFSAIRKLPPAHTLQFKNGQVKIERYWHLHYEPKLPLTEHDLLDELEGQMLEAVRYLLVSDVPVGAFLSGGMGFSLVVGMMQGIRPADQDLLSRCALRALQRAPLCPHGR
jgi:asparagine synthetase B (glutamine-hydrolysing)